MVSSQEVWLMGISQMAHWVIRMGPKGVPRLSRLARSSMMPAGSQIDLALVYANFLNQQPDSKTTGFELPELPDSSLETWSVSNT